MKRILITGITGYIGSNLARALLPDCEVFGLVREPLRTEYIADFQGMLRLIPVDGTYGSIYTALKSVQPHIVYHLAAYYTGAHNSQEMLRLVDSNITFGAYLLEAMSACRVPALAYATTYMTHYQGETYCPVNLYAATKQAFSDLLVYYNDAGLLKTVTLVLSDTYGPGDHRPKILNLIKQAVKTGNRITLSSGEQDYDVVYIDDVISAFRLAGEGLLQGKFCNDFFQVASDHPLTLRQTVEKMCQVNRLDLKAGWGERPAAERETRRAVRLYPTLPGWRSEISLDEGLRLFWADTLFHSQQ